MVAAAMPMLLGFTGLAIDATTWYRGQQRLQMAADAASLGASRLLTNASATTAQFSAIALAEAQGVIASTSGDLATPVVTVAADRSNVKVALSSTAPLYFSGFFISGGVTIKASSTAGPSGGGGSGGGSMASGTCVLALATGNTKNAIDLNNNGTILAPNCRVFANATTAANANSNKAAIYAVNSKIDATGGSVGTAGGALASANGSATITPAAQQNQAAVADPFSSLVAPAQTACSATKQVSYSFGTHNLTPGDYCGGLNLNNGGTNNFAPGVYNILNGDFTITGGATINTAKGVSFYLGGTNPGTLQWTNNAAATITATTSGWMKGMIVYQDRAATNKSSLLAGNATITLDGTIYMPKSDLVVNNNATLTHSASSGLGVVVNTLLVQGSAKIDAGGTIAGSGSTTGNRMIVTQ